MANYLALASLGSVQVVVFSHGAWHWWLQHLFNRLREINEHDGQIQFI